jgi:hypothetical protein
MTKMTFVGSANKGRWNLGNDQNREGRRRSEDHLMARIRSIHPRITIDQEFALIPIPGRRGFPDES